MDPIEHALDDFVRAIINRDNLLLTLYELAQAPTKDLDALDIETIGNIVDSVLWPLDDLVLPGVSILDFGDRVAFETVQLNIRIAVKSPKPELFLKLTEMNKLWQNPQFCSSGSFSF